VILPWIDERREATPAAQEVITIANIQNFNRRFCAVEFRKRVLSWSSHRASGLAASLD
jgi:hypothetical protein